MRIIIFISLVFLASCTTITFSDENSITLEHRIRDHKDAVGEAQKHCQKFNKKVKPDQSSCAKSRCISYFNCIEK